MLNLNSCTCRVNVRFGASALQAALATAGEPRSAENECAATGRVGRRSFWPTPSGRRVPGGVVGALYGELCNVNVLVATTRRDARVAESDGLEKRLGRSGRKAP